MIQMSYNDIISKIKEKSNISEEELNKKIKAKLDQLSGLISKEGAAHIIANELGVKLFEQTSGKLQIKNILTGMRDVETLGQVIRKSEIRKFQVNSRQGQVGNLFIGDETGSIRVVCWGSKADEILKVNEGDIVKIKSGYIKENNGQKEIHMNDKGIIMVNPSGESVQAVKQTVAPRPEAIRKKIAELNETSSNVELFGTVVQTFEPRFFEVCPMCNKRAKPIEGSFFCEEHKKVEPNYSYVLNLVLDDGTETIRAVFFRDQLDKLLNKTHGQVLGYKNNNAEFEPVKNDLLGKQIIIKGRTTKNQMFDRLEFMVNDVNPEPNPKEEIQKINQNK